jgi:D-alanyl-D-alanine carboxypeptidase (penicillin-binding protein 5/6)
MRKALPILLMVSSLQCANALETKASHAYLVDYDTGEVLFEKDAFSPMTPSSMTKLLTTYIIFEKLHNGDIKLTDEFEISENAWKQGGSKMFLEVGKTVSVEDLLRGIIIQSGNDACITAAEGISGSESSFVDLMNKKAKELGLEKSVLKNSNGWPAEGHVMSAKDLATLSKALITNFPEYYSYFAEKEFAYNGIKQQNRNTLLKRMKEVDGLKTGSTDLGGYGITATAKNDSRRVITVVNGLKNERERIKEAEILLKYGLNNFDNIKFQATEKEPFRKLAVAQGNKDYVKAGFEKNQIFTVVKEDIKNASVTFKYQEPLVAPISKGDKIGELLVQIPNKEPQTISVIALDDVNRHWFFKKIYRNITGYFSK